MPKAIWKGRVIAEAGADSIERVEGNVYFPPDAVKREYLEPSETHTVCGWKGTASYYHVAVDGEINRDAAWYYPSRRMPRATSRATSLSGKASRSNDGCKWAAAGARDRRVMSLAIGLGT